MTSYTEKFKGFIKKGYKIILQLFKTQRIFTHYYPSNHKKLWQNSNFGFQVYPEPLKSYPTNIYLFKVNNRNTKKSCEICSKLIIKTVVLVSFLLTFNIFHTFF